MMQFAWSKYFYILLEVVHRLLHMFSLYSDFSKGLAKVLFNFVIRAPLRKKKRSHFFQYKTLNVMFARPDGDHQYYLKLLKVAALSALLKGNKNIVENQFPVLRSLSISVLFEPIWYWWERKMLTFLLYSQFSNFGKIF